LEVEVEKEKRSSSGKVLGVTIEIYINIINQVEFLDVE
jgi:putative lipoic acid-binding regulatory protein